MTIAERVADYCQRHGLLPAGPVLALVSGGADSLALMHLLAELSPAPPVVASFDHGLRAEAGAEATEVCRSAEALGLRAEVRRLDVGSGSGLQERAREARYAAARELARETGCERIATGHTASDQAETVLFRLARGTGRTGALGMAPRAGELIRPLLCLTRDETTDLCAARGLRPASDPSNDDARFARTRVRDGLLRALADVHPAAERHVGAFADLLRDEAALLDELVESALARVRCGDVLDAAALRTEPVALVRLVVRRAILEAGGGGEAMAGAAVDRAIAVVMGVTPRAELPGGLIVTRSRGRVSIRGPATLST